MLTNDQLQSYQTAIERAVYFDLKSYGKIAVTGLDAATFLHNLSTNDIKKLKVGDGCEAFLCNHKARTLAYVFISRRQDGSDGTPRLLLDMLPSLREKVLQHLNKYLISEQAEIIDHTQGLWMIRLVGTAARPLLEEALGTSLSELQPLQQVGVGNYLVRSQTMLSLPSFDIIYPMEEWGYLWDALLARDILPVVPEEAHEALHDVLRIEAGTPEYGKDMDDERFVAEVGRTAQAISYTKGCYLGQEPIVMARDRGQVNRTLMGVCFRGAKDAVPHGSKLFAGETEVGQVTSSTFSPRLGQAIALAYIRRGHQQPGTKLLCDGLEAVVSELPFVRG